MKECMETDNPLVSIVMATYNPRMDWLKEQLSSLNDQNYEALELLVLDDCSPNVSFEAIRECVEECITKMPFQILQNEENLGSTKTFEKLTLLASGEYIAYCDQDDVWHKEKIVTLLDYFTNESLSIVYSDVVVIDESGNKKANSITEYRPRHVLYEGPNLSKRLVIQNFVIGCTMLIKAGLAQQAVPFISNMVHDHYLAVIASVDGKLALCKEPLVFYRIHNQNQTNTLSNIKCKDDYYLFKIKKFIDRLEQIELRKVNEKIPDFDDIKKWATAREAYYNKSFRYAKNIWKFRNFDPGISMFELLAIKMPDRVFSYVLKKIKKEDN